MLTLPINEIKKEIDDLLRNDRLYKAYSKETTIKAILIDINNILDKYIPTNKESTFILEEQEYNSFELIYKLADKGIINLEHNDIEKNGVEVTL